MGIEKIGSVVGAGNPGAVDGAKEKFGKLLEGAGKVKDAGAHAQPRPSVQPENAPKPVVDAQRAEGVARAERGCVQKAPGVAEARGVQGVQTAAQARVVEGARVLDQVTAAQKRLDSILQLAQSGKSFSAAELIAMQAQVHRASQELDLAGKVVEKATGGVKQILQTQV